MVVNFCLACVCMCVCACVLTLVIQSKKVLGAQPVKCYLGLEMRCAYKIMNFISSVSCELFLKSVL